LSYPQPPVERFAKTPKDIDEFCRIINDGFAELIAKEKDHFPAGWRRCRWPRRTPASAKRSAH